MRLCHLIAQKPLCFSLPNQIKPKRHVWASWIFYLSFGLQTTVWKEYLISYLFYVTYTSAKFDHYHPSLCHNFLPLQYLWIMFSLPECSPIICDCGYTSLVRGLTQWYFTHTVLLDSPFPVGSESTSLKTCWWPRHPSRYSTTEVTESLRGVCTWWVLKHWWPRVRTSFCFNSASSY